MSASLVGSEMCIRDRMCTERARGPKFSPTGATVPAPRSTSGALAGLFRPVSYTHLTLPTICSV
eukprot:9573604-Alexandrium_andersonii.AAC.1